MSKSGVPSSMAVMKDSRISTDRNYALVAFVIHCIIGLSLEPANGLELNGHDHFLYESMSGSRDPFKWPWETATLFTRA
jgi:hypothetical protein